MRVSVVVPTYKRPQSLARCLDALERQVRPAQEVLVAVRVGDLASQEVVRARAEPVRLVPVERPGVVAAMNAGIDASSGDVVALTDDDAAPRRTGWSTWWLCTRAMSTQGWQRWAGATGYTPNRVG